MSLDKKFEVCIIGAGSAGLSVASGASQLGLRVVLVERGEMGGDCLNTGCVPSKALLAAGKRAHSHRKDDIKGIKAYEPDIDFSAVKDHVFDTIKTIAPHDSQDRFEKLGVTVIRDTAHFIDPHTIKVGKDTIQARYFVIATGSRAFIPPITGLDNDKILTNETIFDLREQPKHLIIVGGGPIGIEMAQAHRRLGCKVSVFDMSKILPRDDQDNVKIVRETLIDEGIDLYETIKIQNIEHTKTGVTLNILDKKNKKSIIKGTHILMATGRTPNIENMNLDIAQVKYTKKSIEVDDHLRTNQRHIFAIGDVSGGPQFTHVAGYHAGLIIRQICFKMIWTKTNYKALPWVTYCDPELAQVGLTKHDARKKYGDDINVVSSKFDGNDRAIAERKAKGQIFVVTDKKGVILGASIVGSGAGELIGVWALAISSKLKINAFTDMIAPYPTLGEINKRVAGAYFTSKLFSAKTQNIVKWLQKLPL